MMASRSRKIRAGLFVLGAAALAVIAVASFGGIRMFRSGDSYHVEYEDSVYGLEEGANVYMSGVRIGSVEEIAVSPDDPRLVRVRIEVEAGTQVRADTRALLQFTGITGLKVIDLRGGSPGAALLPPGSRIAPAESTLDKLEKRAAVLSEQAVAMMDRATKILDNVSALTAPSSELIRTAQRGAEDVAAAGATLRAIAEENRAPIRTAIADVGRSARAASALMDGPAAQIAADSGEAVGQIRALIRDNGAALRGIVFDLRQATRSLKELAREVRQRPSQLLFSDAQGERKLP